jgi:hypothetical protein
MLRFRGGILDHNYFGIRQREAGFLENRTSQQNVRFFGGSLLLIAQGWKN